MKKCIFAALIMGLVTGSLLLWAAQAQPAQQTPSPAPRGPQPKTKPEYDAYMKFSAETDLAKKTAAGEQFIKDYPNSELVAPGVYPLMIDAFQRLNNYEKTLEYGDKLLAVDPQSPLGLVTMAQLIPERVKEDDLDRSQKLERAAAYAKKLLEVSGTLQKIPQATEEQWKLYIAQLQGGAHAALGFVALHRKEYEEAVKEYKTSIELFNKDYVVYYRLGVAYTSQKKMDEAIQSLVNSVALKAPDQVRSFLEQLYKSKHNGSLEGLDKLIADAASQIK